MKVKHSALTLCARSHRAMGQLESAETCLRQAAEVPVARRSEALGVLSDIYKATDRREGAMDLLREARTRIESGLATLRS